MIICTDCRDRKKYEEENPTVKIQYKYVMQRIALRDHAMEKINREECLDMINKLDLEKIKYANMAKNVERSMMRTNWEIKTND